MALGVERPGARDLDHVATPTAFGAVELDEGSVAAHAVPTLERHVLYSPHSDAAINRNPLRLHVVVIRRIGPLPSAVSRVLEPFRFVPVAAVGCIVHVVSPSDAACGQSRRSAQMITARRNVRKPRQSARWLRPAWLTSVVKRPLSRPPPPLAWPRGLAA